MADNEISGRIGIRAMATADDVERIVAAPCNAALADADRATLRRGLLRTITHPATAPTLVYLAEEDISNRTPSSSVSCSYGGVVGFASVFFEWSDWRAGKVWWVRTLKAETSHGEVISAAAVRNLLVTRLKQEVANDPTAAGLRLITEALPTSGDGDHHHRHHVPPPARPQQDAPSKETTDGFEREEYIIMGWRRPAA